MFITSVYQLGITSNIPGGNNQAAGMVLAGFAFLYFLLDLYSWHHTTEWKKRVHRARWAVVQLAATPIAYFLGIWAWMLIIIALSAIGLYYIIHGVRAFAGGVRDFVMDFLGKL